MKTDEIPAISAPGDDVVEFHGIVLSRAWIAEFRRRHHVRSFALFGSILRDDFGPDSDIDVLIEFEPGKAPGLGFFGLRDELSEHFGRPVDLNTPGFLGRYFREQVKAEAVSLHGTDGLGSTSTHA